MPEVLLGAWLLFTLSCSGGSLAATGILAEASIQELQGKWLLESINGRAVKSEPAIYFKIDGRTITGFDGCNSFGGSLDAPDQLRITQRACPSGGPRLPLELSDPRPQLESSRLEGDTLELKVGDEGDSARFRRQPAE